MEESFLNLSYPNFRIVITSATSPLFYYLQGSHLLYFLIASIFLKFLIILNLLSV